MQLKIAKISQYLYTLAPKVKSLLQIWMRAQKLWQDEHDED